MLKFVFTHIYTGHALFGANLFTNVVILVLF